MPPDSSLPQGWMKLRCGGDLNLYLTPSLSACVFANCLMHPICSIYDVVGWVQSARVPPTSFLYVAIKQSCTSYPPSWLKCELSGVIRMQTASFMTNSIVRLACCSILGSPQRMGWSSVQACLAIADLSIKPLMARLVWVGIDQQAKYTD